MRTDHPHGTGRGNARLNAFVGGPQAERLRDGIKGSDYLDVATIFGVPQGDPLAVMIKEPEELVRKQL